LFCNKKTYHRARWTSIFLNDYIVFCCVRLKILPMMWGWCIGYVCHARHSNKALEITGNKLRPIVGDDARSGLGKLLSGSLKNDFNVGFWSSPALVDTF